MGCANVAATLHRHLCEHSAHGYTQGSGRNGSGASCKVEVEGMTYTLKGGDRDCSSSACECWQAALRGTRYEGVLDGATYTGNMRSVFVASGLFEWKPMTFIAQRGDLYLNEGKHVAMCQSAVPDMLSEFLINEKGTITGGKVGDQTGRESLVRAYYDFPWNGILHYNGKADGDWSDMATKAEIESAVWDHKINGKKASELLALNNSKTDPTGRGMELNDHDHIKWIAATLVDMREEVREIRKKLEIQ